MACGCRSNAPKQARNTTLPSRVLQANIQPKQETHVEKILQEKRIVEIRRRENILKALKRP